MTDPLGNRTTWAYDAADRLTTMTDSHGSNATYVYSADDQLTDTTDRDGRRTTFSLRLGRARNGRALVDQLRRYH